MKYVIFNTFAEAETRINNISDTIYNSGRWTDGITRYLTKAISNTDGRGAFCIVNGYENYYTQAELNNAVELTVDWFPKNNIII